MLGIGLNDAAGRTAYLAGFNAAKALLFEHEHRDKNYTSHGRVQAYFARLTKGDERIDPGLRAFLSNAYNLKRLADYETGPDAQVSAERAKKATEMAHRFVTCIAGLLSPNGRTPRVLEDVPKS